MQKEINKLLKKISGEKLKNNHKECVELYNIVGGLYSDIGSYNEAIHYHEKALELCKTLGDRLGVATASRFIGECQAATGNFTIAIEHIKKYLDLVEKLHNKVEIQRAWTTLGRVYLMQAQEMKDNTHVIDGNIKAAAKEAEKRFDQAITLADSIREEVDAKEFAQMKSGLFVNKGLVKDILNEHKNSVLMFIKAIETCKSSKIKEDLFRCQIILASIFRQRDNIKLASKQSQDALDTANSIGKKILICDALIEKGLVQLLLRDFKSAKRTFARAYLEKSPNEEDHSKAIRLTKLAHLISEYYDKMAQQDAASETRYKLCDKLGDLFVAIGCYKLAVEFYKRAFTDAKICGKSNTELARILYSIAETYADYGQFVHARICYEKELTHRNGNISEQCQTLVKIAHMDEYLNKPAQDVVEAYEKALDKANKDPILMFRVLKDYVPYLKKSSFSSTKLAKMEDLLLNIKSFREVLEEIDKETQEDAGEDFEDEIANIDDIITDDEEDDEVLMIGRRRARGTKKFKANEVGDTPLHEASIKGDIKRVKSLIAQGHEVNPRDNAGWIPLHEACNHGHYEIAEFLIEHGADVSNRGLKGTSPLHDAATNGHYDIMRLLIRNGANVIALTDTGETVLSCLRDHKARCYSTMSNAELSEYTQMEAELLNHMDKCGFNLMEEKMKTSNKTEQLVSERDSLHGTSKSGHQRASSSSSRSLSRPLSSAQQAPLPRPQSRLNMLDTNQAGPSATVKDYRDVIGTLKRKRLNEGPSRDELEADELKKAAQPAIYSTDINTSAPTKEWLIDDISRERRILGRRSNLETLMADWDEDLCSDDENAPRQPSNPMHNAMAKASSSARSECFTPPLSLCSSSASKNNSRKANETKKAILISDDEFEADFDLDALKSAANKSAVVDQANDEDVIVLDSQPEAPASNSNEHFLYNEQFPIRSPSNVSSVEDIEILGNTSRSNFSVSPSLMSSAAKQRRETPRSINSFDMLSEPLAVTIDGRKLLIPIKDKLLTIRQLKRAIAERYSVLVDGKPNISLAPVGDPSCVLFDDDFCEDVLQDHVVAKVESWHLEPLAESYRANCAKLKLKPSECVGSEARRIEVFGNKLDISYAAIPKEHAPPFTSALSNRDFSCVDLTGVWDLFHASPSQAERIMDTMASWRRLTQLKLSCLGLTRQHFERLCSRFQQLAELKSLDLSYNAIDYKCKLEFASQCERLLEACVKLKRLDITKNLLRFVRQLETQKQQQQAADTCADARKNEAREGALLNLVHLLARGEGSPRQTLANRVDLEILGAEQSEFDVYSA